MTSAETQREKRRQWYLANRVRVLARVKARAIVKADSIRAYKKAWHLRNAERLRAEKAAKYRANRDAILAKSSAEYAANPGPSRERARRYRSTNPDKAKAAVVRWCHANSERLRLAKLEYSRWRKSIDPTYGRAGALLRKARLKHARIDGRVDFKAVWRRSNGVCGICAGAIGDDPFHFDHIVPLAAGGPHTTSNLQVAHARCNLRKGARTA